MGDVGRKSHWENVYASKGEREVSWFQENPANNSSATRIAND